MDIARQISRGERKRGERLSEADCQVPTSRLVSDWSGRIKT